MPKPRLTNVNTIRSHYHSSNVIGAQFNPKYCNDHIITNAYTKRGHTCVLLGKVKVSDELKALVGFISHTPTNVFMNNRDSIGPISYTDRDGKFYKTTYMFFNLIDETDLHLYLKNGVSLTHGFGGKQMIEPLLQIVASQKNIDRHIACYTKNEETYIVSFSQISEHLLNPALHVNENDTKEMFFSSFDSLNTLDLVKSSSYNQIGRCYKIEQDGHILGVTYPTVIDNKIIDKPTEFDYYILAKGQSGFYMGIIESPISEDIFRLHNQGSSEYPNFCLLDKKTGLPANFGNTIKPRVEVYEKIASLSKGDIFNE